MEKRPREVGATLGESSARVGHVNGHCAESRPLRQETLNRATGTRCGNTVPHVNGFKQAKKWHEVAVFLAFFKHPYTCLRGGRAEA